MNNKELADWLEANVDSHGIYDAEMLTQLDAGDAAVIVTHTRAETAEDIRARGLGGNLAEEGPDSLFYGWQAAEALCRRRLGQLPERVLRIQGRGTIFRICVEALREQPDVEQEDKIQRFPHEVLPHWRTKPDGTKVFVEGHVRGPA